MISSVLSESRSFSTVDGAIEFVYDSRADLLGFPIGVRCYYKFFFNIMALELLCETLGFFVAVVDDFGISMSVGMGESEEYRYF